MSAVSAVVGVGHTRYGRLPEFDAYELGLWALKDALADAGLSFADIDGLIVNRIPDYQRFCEIAGINPDYVNITPGQGRFSGIDIETAAALIRDGLATTVALVYGNNGRSAGDRYGGAGDTYGSGARQLVSLWHDLARRVPRADGAPPHGALRHDAGPSRHGLEDVPRSRRAQSVRRDAQPVHARRLSRLALHLRAAAPARLLPDQ